MGYMMSGRGNKNASSDEVIKNDDSVHVLGATVAERDRVFLFFDSDSDSDGFCFNQVVQASTTFIYGLK